MHEGEEVIPCTSSRKRRFRSSFRYSTMKELKRARESKKKARSEQGDGISVKKTLTFLEMNEGVGDMTGDAIYEIEGEVESANIIMVSNLSSHTSLLVKFCRVIGWLLAYMDMDIWVAMSSSKLCSIGQIWDDEDWNFNAVEATPRWAFRDGSPSSSSSCCVLFALLSRIGFFADPILSYLA